MLNEALRLLRTFHDLKQADLADRLGVGRSYISELESGAKTPSMDVLKRYSDNFNVPVSSIMFFAENVEESEGRSNRIAKAKGAIATKIIRFLQAIDERS